MAELLRTTAQEVDPRDLEFLLNEERAGLISEALQRYSDPRIRLRFQVRHAAEVLNAGKSEQALEEIRSIQASIRERDPLLWERGKRYLRGMEAMALFRQAEDENCCSSNTADSCLVPIRGGGVHRKPEGSTGAVKVLEAMLRDDPADLEARWLLNLAAMTLGKYPSGVSPRWRIAPEVFQSEYPLRRFTNVAPSVGIQLLGRAGGCVLEDLDGDQDLDILISGMGFQDPLRLMANQGDGSFTERTEEMGLPGITGGLNMNQADFDNDGKLDVLVLRGGWMRKAGRFPFSLLRNLGAGKFTDVTRSAGLLRFGPTQAATWFDYDNDGWVDLFVGFESSEKGGDYPCALYRNNRDGTFTDVAQQAGVGFSDYVKGAVSGDYDRDGWPDLFTTAGGPRPGKNSLFHNNRDGTFTEVSAEAGLTGPDHSFGTFFFDYDNDGWQDLFVMGYAAEGGVKSIAADYLGMPTKAERPRLYRNLGGSGKVGKFADVTRSARLYRVLMGMALNYGDLDNDGWLDFYTGTGTPELNMLIPNRMLRNAGGRHFQDVTTAGNFGNLQKGHGIAFGDINNDGQQDVFEQMGGANFGDVAYSTLFANPGHANRWLVLKLEGDKTNRAALGARIKVTVRDASGQRNVYRVVSSGGSFGAGPLRQEIGLGKATEIVRVEIYWPVSRQAQVLSGLALDRMYTVREGETRAVPVKRPSFRWPSSASG